MTEEVEEALLKFTKVNLAGKAGLQVAWYGGEPLLRWKLLERLSRKLIATAESEGKPYSATMVTSGWRLNEEKLRKLAEVHKVSSLQITLEMPPSRHSERRLGPKGENLLSRLLEAIATASKYLNVNVRLNLQPEDITPEVADEIISFLQNHNLLNNPNVSLYPATIDPALSFARVKPETDACELPKESRRDCGNLVLLNLGGRISNAVAQHRTGRESTLLGNLASFFSRSSCCAVLRDAFVVMPDGSLHKCWGTVGQAGEEIGDVRKGVRLSSPNLCKWLSFQLTDFETCVDCCIFPICLGGCTLYRLRRYPRKTHRCLVGFVEFIRAMAEDAGRRYLGMSHPTVTLVYDCVDYLPEYFES